MKLINIARIAIILTLISCGNDDSVVTIPKQEYQKLIGDTIQPIYPKPFTLNTDGFSQEKASFWVAMVTNIWSLVMVIIRRISNITSIVSNALKGLKIL